MSSQIQNLQSATWFDHATVLNPLIFGHTVKIYTRTGDSGSTGLFGGPRVDKDDDRIESYGTVDELNAVLGTVRSCPLAESLDQVLCHIQNELFSIGAELASPDPDQFNLRVIQQGHIARLESWIDEFEADLPELKAFILPAGAPAASHLHVARAVCRRAERRTVTLQKHPSANVSETVVVYLNRLSDLLFVLARFVNHEAGLSDAPWVKPETLPCQTNPLDPSVNGSETPPDA